MSTKIFVNLPVKDLNRSIDFFTRLGFTFNPQFTDETATCMVVSEDIFVMLLTHDKFKTFTPKEICDATKSTEVLVCLSVESREGVKWFARRSPPEAAPTMTRRTMVLCMRMGFRIWMVIFGNSSIWNQAR